MESISKVRSSVTSASLKPASISPIWCFEVGDYVALVVNLRGARFQGLLRAGHRIQGLVLDLHQCTRLFQRLQGFGGDGDDGLAGVTHLVLGQDRRVHGQGADEQSIRRNVPGGHHRFDPRHVAGLAHIDVQDAGVGIVAAHETAVQRVFHGNVRGVPRLPANLVKNVIAGQSLADGFGRIHNLVRVALPRLLARLSNNAVVFALPVCLLFERAKRELLAFRFRPVSSHILPLQYDPGVHDDGLSFSDDQWIEIDFLDPGLSANQLGDSEQRIHDARNVTGRLSSEAAQNS